MDAERAVIGRASIEATGTLAFSDVNAISLQCICHALTTLKVSLACPNYKWIGGRHVDFVVVHVLQDLLLITLDAGDFGCEVRHVVDDDGLCLLKPIAYAGRS